MTSRTRRLQAVRIWRSGLWEPFQAPERRVEGFGVGLGGPHFDRLPGCGSGCEGGVGERVRIVAGLLTHPGAYFLPPFGSKCSHRIKHFLLLSGFSFHILFILLSLRLRVLSNIDTAVVSVLTQNGKQPPAPVE